MTDEGRKEQWRKGGEKGRERKRGGRERGRRKEGGEGGGPLIEVGEKSVPAICNPRAQKTRGGGGEGCTLEARLG